jgi:hypothetical protein
MDPIEPLAETNTVGIFDNLYELMKETHFVAIHQNIFRFTGDFIRLLAILFLIWKIMKKKSCLGISTQTQVFYALVVITRYLDVSNIYISAYNTSFKVFRIFLY